MRVQANKTDHNFVRVTTAQSTDVQVFRVSVQTSSWRPPGMLGLLSSRKYLFLVLVSLLTVSHASADAITSVETDATVADTKALQTSNVVDQQKSQSGSETNARQGRYRWARSTTERSLVIQQSPWTPITSKNQEKTPSLLLPFGRKLSRDYQVLRKASTLEEVKPSNIRKRNFGATFADAFDKENAEKITDINDLPTSKIKPQSTRPWDEGNSESDNDGDVVKGDRIRGAFSRNPARDINSKDWERLRLNVKPRPKPEPLPVGSSGPNRNVTEQRGRIRLKGSFLGLYAKGNITPRTPRTDEELPQRPDKRERIRNLRIRRPLLSDPLKTFTTSTTPSPSSPSSSSAIVETKTIPTTIVTTTTTATTVSALSSSTSTTETIINLKAIVKEYKEIVRTSSTPTSVSSTQVSVKPLMDATTAATTTLESSSASTTSSITSTTDVQDWAVTDISTLSSKSLSKNPESLPNSDSTENAIVDQVVESAASKSFKPSIQSTTPSTTASLTVTESKSPPVPPGSSDIKQSKTQPIPISKPDPDPTTRNPIEILRPREELQKDLIEAIKRKISRSKSNRSQVGILKGDIEGQNIIPSARPSLFRPVASINIKKNSSKSDSSIHCNTYSRVNIFNNLPNKYQEPPASIKNPSIVTRPEKKYSRNDGETLISEETQFVEIEKSVESVVKSHSSSVQIVTHSNDSGNQETIRKQLFEARGKPGSGIKYPFESTTTTVSTTTTTSTVSTTTIGGEVTTTDSVSTAKTTVSNKKKKLPAKARDHPSSHFRPIQSNWTNGDFIPMPKSNLPPQEDVHHFNIITPKYATEKSVSEKNSEVKKEVSENINQEPSTSSIEGGIANTTIYVIAVIATIPVLALVAWGVRSVLRRKGLAGSESSSETGLNRPITEDDSLQVSGRGAISFVSPSHNHIFDPISEAPENIPKVLEHGGGNPGAATDMLGSVWEFPRSRLRLQTVLGEGNFGKVWKAEADEICGYDGTILVAVKTVKEGSAQKEVDDLVQEMKIMQEIGSHPNVVTILGVCTEQEPYLLLMEYVMYGKLLTHLREHRIKQSSFFNFSKDGADVGETLTSKDLTKFAYGVAKGMEYLVSKGIIHRDLAARNILVDHNKNTKISDFGLSRSLRDLGSEMYEQKTKGALPIRWMAPESLYFSVFTPKSDVWGFGILMWEIVTLGSTPYPGMGAREVMRKVRDGYRLERPAHCHPDFYLIIQKCWLGDMNKRPDFSELRKELAKLLEDQHGYIDLLNIPEHKYYSMDKNPDEDEKL